MKRSVIRMIITCFVLKDNNVNDKLLSTLINYFFSINVIFIRMIWICHCVAHKRIMKNAIISIPETLHYVSFRKIISNRKLIVLFNSSVSN